MGPGRRARDWAEADLKDGPQQACSRALSRAAKKLLAQLPRALPREHALAPNKSVLVFEIVPSCFRFFATLVCIFLSPRFRDAIILGLEVMSSWFSIFSDLGV